MAVSGGVVALAGTFALTFAFYALTAHVAARYVLGDVPVDRALVVGGALAVVSFLLQRYGPLVVLPVTVVVGFVAVHAVYRVRYRTAAVVTVVYYTVAVLLAVVLFNLVRLLGTAPT